MPLRKAGSRMLDGKTVLISGAGGGIGRASAIAMVRCHANVFMLGRREAALDETARLTGDDGTHIGYMACDITNLNDVKMAIEKAVATFGKLTSVLNNAAVFFKTDILSKALEPSWEQNFRVNIMGTIHVIHESIPYLMQNQKSSIINISSIDAYSGCKGYTGYSASKGAVISLTRGLALDLGQYNIRVNAIAPGITDTPMTHQRIEAKREEYLSKVAIKRIGKAEDIADSAVFLASDMSDYITGQVIQVNGGMQFI